MLDYCAYSLNIISAIVCIVWCNVTYSHIFFVLINIIVFQP